MANKKVFDSEALKENLIDLKDRIKKMESNFEDSVKEKAVQTKENVESKIRENPMQSAGIVFGAGVFAGVMAASMMNRR